MNKKSFLNEIADKVLIHGILDVNKYWNTVFDMVKEYKPKNDTFFDRPEWRQIRELFECSFEFVLEEDELDKPFEVLIAASDAVYDAFTGEIYKKGMYRLCRVYLGAYYTLVNKLQKLGVFHDDYCDRIQLLHMVKTGYRDMPMPAFRFFSPVFIENFCAFYDFITNDTSILTIEDAVMFAIYRDVVRKKFVRMFDREMFTERNHYIMSGHNKPVPKLINCADTSSMTPMDLTACVGKIAAYAERNRTDSINIAIIGYRYYPDCSKAEINAFCDALRSIACESMITFYVNGKADRDDIIFRRNVSVCFVDYQKLFSLRTDCVNICDVVDRHNIVLIHDAPNLYEYNWRTARRSSQNFPDCGSSYGALYHRFNFKSNDFLDRMYQYLPVNLLMTKLDLLSRGKDTYDDTIEYRLHTAFMEYMFEYITSMCYQSEHVVHILMSRVDITDPSDHFGCITGYKERCDGHDICSIAVSSVFRPVLKMYRSDTSKNFVIFTLWDLFQNIDCDFLKNPLLFNDILRCSEDVVNELAGHIYIKLQWDLSCKSFAFSIHKGGTDHGDTVNVTSLAVLLERLFLAIFSCRNDSFGAVVKNAFLDVVYGQLEYMDDAVFYNFLTCGFFDGFSVSYISTGFPERPVHMENSPIYLGIVRILNLLTGDLDRADRKWTIHQLYEDNKDYYAKSGIDSVSCLAGWIHSICERYGYQNSIVYANTKPGIF